MIYVRQENAGVSSARNNGTRLFQSEWVAFLDSDDVWDPGHIARVHRAIEATAGRANLYFADTVFSGIGSSSLWALAGLKIDSEWSFVADGSDWVMSRLQPMMIQTSVVRRTSLLEIRGFDERLRSREDTLVFFLMGLVKPICAVNGVGTFVCLMVLGTD